MSEKLQRLFRNFALFITLALFAACSSDDNGGDDASGGGGGGSTSYTGLTTAADIGAGNALVLSTQAIETAAMMTVLRIPSSLQSQGSDPGPCGGLFTYNYDFVPGNPPEGPPHTFTGDFGFDDYCEYEKDGITPIILSGQMNISGSLPGNKDIKVTTTIDNVGLLIRDATDTVYWLRNYEMYVEAKYTGSFANITIDPVTINPNSPLTIEIFSGSKFYHPNYGYVLVSTPTPLYFTSAADEWPSSGVIEIIEDAAVLPVDEDIGKAILTALLDSSQDPARQYYQLQVDFTNDGIFDYTIPDGDWADL